MWDWAPQQVVLDSAQLQQGHTPQVHSQCDSRSGVDSPLSAAAARVWREELSSSALLVAAFLLKRDGEHVLRFLEWTPLLTSTS